jgi:rhodanese-related sulfurtransferase
MDHEIMEVNVAAAHEKIKNGAVLLDVRELEEIQMLAFNVERQILMPVSELSVKHSELPIDREIIVGCHSGNRSLKMTRFLMDQNFKNVYNMKGGIRDWMEQGLPVKWEE